MVDVLMRKFIVALLALSSVTGCGGGGAASAVPNAPARSASVVTKLIRIDVPAAAKTGARVSDYVSRNTQGVGVSFGASPFTFPANTTPTAAFDVSGVSPLCTAGLNGARTCTVTVAAPVGTDDFQVTAWDAVPAAGGFTGATALSTVTVLSQSIASGTNTPLNLTLNGIVSSLNTTVAPSSLSAMSTGGTPATATVSVNALDAYGNIIMGSGNWVDANGNTLAVTVTPTTAPNGGPMLTVPSTPTGVTPAAPTFTVTYSGGSTWGTTFTPGVVGGTIAGNVTGATLNVTPTVTLYPVVTASSSPWRITSASDGNIYFTESTAQQIARIAPATGTVTEISQSGSPGEQPTGIIQASDGNIWFLKYNPGSSATVQHVPTGASFSAANITGFTSMNPYGTQQDLVDGGNGCIYITEPGAADIFNVAIGSCTGGPSYPDPGGGTPVGIVKGPDGNLWFADSNGEAIRNLTLPGLSFNSYATSGFPQYLTTGSDGNLWYTASNGNFVSYFSTSGAAPASTFATPLSLGSVNGITSGSDGALWFAGRGPSAPGNGGIGRVTTSGIVTTYFAGFGSADDPFGMTTDANGYMWFTEPSANKIGRLIY